MAAACQLGCFVCGGKNGGGHTGGCCGGGACCAPEVQRYDGDEAGLNNLLAQLHQQLQATADRLATMALIAQEKAAMAAEDRAREVAAEEQRVQSQSAIQAREQALRGRQDQAIRDAAPKPKVVRVSAKQKAVEKQAVKAKQKAR